MTDYLLTSDGDRIEKLYYEKFIARDFPSYQIFWQKFVTPLTQRPVSIFLKNDSELERDGKSSHHVCLAQLHYSILLHLVRAFELLQQIQFIDDHLLFGLTALCGAQDIAFELLERFNQPTKYKAWPIMLNGTLLDDGEKARRKWQKSHDYPLKVVRDYRNRLIHGRMPPSIIPPNQMENALSIFLPKLGLESQYFDWRKATYDSIEGNLPLGDFANVRDILDESWRLTTEYLESSWKINLLPRL